MRNVRFGIPRVPELREGEAIPWRRVQIGWAALLWSRP